MKAAGPFLALLAGGLLTQGMFLDSARLVGLAVLGGVAAAWVSLREVTKEDQR